MRKMIKWNKGDICLKGENMAKIEIERSMCISCGNCIELCPELFEFAEDELSTLIDGERVGDNDEQEIGNPGCAVDAEANCPVSIIHVYD